MHNFSCFSMVSHIIKSYANPDLVLLDDPLSAVDAQVARHLFEECIGREGIFIKQNPNCTRILVTHQVKA